MLAPTLTAAAVREYLRRSQIDAAASVDMDKTVATVAGALSIVLTAGFVALAWAGRDTAGYVLFVGGPLVSTVVGILLTKKVAAVAQVVDVVKHQTNDLLTARLDSLDTQLSEAAVDRSAKAGGPPDDERTPHPG